MVMTPMNDNRGRTSAAVFLGYPNTPVEIAGKAMVLIPFSFASFIAFLMRGTNEANSPKQISDVD